MAGRNIYGLEDEDQMDGLDGLIDPRVTKYLSSQYEDAMNKHKDRTAQTDALMNQDRPSTDYGLYAALAKAASQVGTLGGKAADTSAVDMAANHYMNQEDMNKKRLADYLSKRRDMDKSLLSADLKRVQGESDLFGKATLAGVKALADAASRSSKIADDRAYKEEQKAQERAYRDDIRQDDIARRKAERDESLVQKRAKESEEEKTRYVNVKGSINQLRDIVKEYGTGELFGSVPDKINNLIYNMAIDYAKLVDPESVVREGEAAAAKKYSLPFGESPWTTRNSTALAQLDEYEKVLEARKKSRELAKSGDLNTDPFTGKAFDQLKDSESSDFEKATTLKAAPANANTTVIIDPKGVRRVVPKADLQKYLDAGARPAGGN